MNYQPAEQMNHPRHTGGTLLYDVHCVLCKSGTTHPYEEDKCFDFTYKYKAPTI